MLADALSSVGMCGRYTLRTPPDRLATAFDLDEEPCDLKPRFNIAPGSDVAVIANRGGRRVEMFRWGLIPHWAKDPSIGQRMINARAETAAEKPSFRTPLRRHRCLVLADGFYEWQGAKAPKRPMYARMKSGEPFAFAGLWDTWVPADAPPLHSCTILTTEPNAVMAPIHNRMPVILEPDAYAVWIDPERLEPADLQALLRPFPAERMEAYEVSRAVNNPSHDAPDCIAAAE